MPVVNVDVVVTDNNGNYLKDLKKENFRISEDGTVQTITNFAPSEAPITIVLLLEFSKLGYQFFTYNARNWAAAFLGNLKPNDWVALETFNMRSNVDVDFTHNRDEIMQGLYSHGLSALQRIESFRRALRCAGSHQGREGQESRAGARLRNRYVQQDDLDQTMKRIRETDATIFTVGVGEMFFMNQAPGAFGQQLTYIQAQNQLKTFAAMTGGRSWLPRFDGEIPEHHAGRSAEPAQPVQPGIFVHRTRRSTANTAKSKWKLVAPDGGPLTVLDQKGKKVKFQVYARQGYTAPKSNVDTK